MMLATSPRSRPSPSPVKQVPRTSAYLLVGNEVMIMWVSGFNSSPTLPFQTILITSGQPLDDVQVCPGGCLREAEPGRSDAQITSQGAQCQWHRITYILVRPSFHYNRPSYHRRNTRYMCDSRPILCPKWYPGTRRLKLLDTGIWIVRSADVLARFG
jgi:hypothetical protein